MSAKSNTADKRTPVVMIVDDEEMVTSSLSSLLSMDTEYTVLSYQSPQEALEILKQRSVDLVITDFLMPGMDGLQFIARAQEMYPELACILLTGYADKQNAIKAINEVSLFQYIEKPWDNEHIKMSIRNALEKKKLREALQDKVRELDEVLLERDRLFQDHELLKEEMALAQSVQQSMLPAAFPNSSQIMITAKYEPALEIGGDFYDVIPLANSKFAILLADITGHGIQAALSTVLLKSALLELKNKDLGPREIMSSINRQLYNILPKHIYAAALVVTIDPHSNECRIVNGGVPHPFLVNSNESKVTRIPVNGLILGVADKELFNPGEETSVRLRPGETLVLYTDGLSEVVNEQEEHFSDHMLSSLSEAAGKGNSDILEHVCDRAKRFSKPHHAWDDITLLAVTRK